MKLKTWKEISKISDIQQAAGKKIVFTNGCFDIIHAGHVQYLAEAKALGDVLIIGLNSDKSVKRLKGNNRPINSESDRAIVLSAFSSIDYIVLFNEDTPHDLISLIIPDILVKGGDWPEDKIVGADIVKANDGLVKTLQFKAGNSTTDIIKRIKNG